MLAENRKAVGQIIAELNPLIIGQNRAAWQCNCGCISAGPAEAIEIDPAGDAYAGQEMYWYLWSVQMQDLETSKHSYSLGLSDFVDVAYLELLFEKQFGNAEEVERKEKVARTLYELETQDAERVHAKLPAGIAIQDNGSQTRFIIDWGREQVVAATIYDLYATTERLPTKGSDIYNHVIEVLKGIKNPQMYRKGPDPVQSYESDYIMDYDGALALLTGDGYNHLFMQNVGSQIDSQGEVYTHINIAFAKFER